MTQFPYTELHSKWPEGHELVSLAALRRYVNIFILTDILYINVALLTHWCAILAQSTLLKNFFLRGYRPLFVSITSHPCFSIRFSRTVLVDTSRCHDRAAGKFTFYFSMFFYAFHIWAPLLRSKMWISLVYSYTLWQSACELFRPFLFLDYIWLRAFHSV